MLLQIRIVGGSIGGLFAATLLRQAGHDVRVYERSVSGLGGRGAGLVGQRDLFRILRQAGCEQAAEVGVTAVERIFLAREGSVASRQATPQTQISWDHLYETFLATQPPGTYELGRAVTHVTADAASATLHFSSGSPEQADLVIGADGVGSVIRDAVMQSPSPSRFAGYVAWRGLIDERQLPADAARVLYERFAFYHMPHSHMLGYLVAGPKAETTLGARRYNWVWYRPVRPDQLADLLTDRHDLRHPFSLAPGTVPAPTRRQLLDDAEALLPPPFAMAVAVEQRPFIQAIFDYQAPHMVRDRLVLLGDAAFVVRPHTAMGVSKAAGDAMLLDQCLAPDQLDRHSLAARLSTYAQSRTEEGRAIAAYGQRLGATLEAR